MSRLTRALACLLLPVSSRFFSTLFTKRSTNWVKSCKLRIQAIVTKEIALDVSASYHVEGILEHRKEKCKCESASRGS
ncbi:hypothetical protein ANTQUA_LOCUS1261 [Anthophora quadrimaculata]